MKQILLLLLLYICSITNTFAESRIINLNVGYKTVNFAGKAVKAIAVNDQIPAPTLHFKKGDHVTINVHNHLDKETTIHWHGILVPWQMDGVSGVSQTGIPPGGAFHYKFTLHQSGTYWYHAHSGLQEQQGLYGSFLIDPPTHPLYKYNKDYVVVLSDWSNTNPDQIMANLKKEGDYYSPNFPLQPSLTKFIHDYRKSSANERNQLLDDYEMMQQMRMSIYDISDVAYDAFLLNGHSRTSPWTGLVNVGDIVRLRFIGAGGSTIFHVKIPNITMQIVHVDGNDIKPYSVNEFTIAPGETYDVLVKIQNNNPYIIYAESIDTVGSAVGALTTSRAQYVDYKQVKPFSEPPPVTRGMMDMMMGNMNSGTMPIPQNMLSMPHMKIDMNMPMDHSGAMSHQTMSHSNTSGKMGLSHDMSMPTEPAIIGDKMSSPISTYITSSGTKYQKMIAAVKTNDPNKPIASVINMELFGYMDRFIWFINGVPEHKAHPIILEPSKRYRFVFTNTSMMHHPMHIHGHWLILRKGNGAYDPLLHTIDVPPGATITADVDTDASGQWVLHCHLLYHMVGGMSRTIQYSTLLEIINDKAKPQNIIKNSGYYNRSIVRVDEPLPIDAQLVKHPHMTHPSNFWLSSYLDVGADPLNNTQRLTYKGLYGPDYNKLELFTNDAEMSKGKIEDADVDIFYWHLVSQFWAVKGGINYTYRPAFTPYWQPGIGIEGLMPYFINTDARVYYHEGSTKLDLELSRDTQITNNFFIRPGIRTIIASKTINSAAIGSGLNQVRFILRPYYRMMPGFNIFAEYEHQSDYGAFENIQHNAGESTSQNTLTFGITALF